LQAAGAKAWYLQACQGSSRERKKAPARRMRRPSLRDFQPPPWQAA
jgi:hypothetical protein